MPRPRRIPRNRISAEKPSEGRARTPRYPQVSRRRGGMVARLRRGEKEQGESSGEAQSSGKAQSGGRALDFIKHAGRRAPKLVHARPPFPARAQSFPDVSAISTLFSTVIFILYLIFISTSLLSIFFYLFPTLIKNRVGDDGVPAILQYRPSDLYPTDRKETVAILQKDTHTPLRICK